MVVLRLGGLGLLMVLFGLSSAAQFQPPGAVTLKDEERQAIEARVGELSAQIERLRRQGVRDPGLAELEIFPRAVQMVLKHNEFYTKNYPAWIGEVLDRGFLRVKQAGRGETPWLYQTGQAVVRAYRSRIDGSVQPYAVTFPADYGKVASKQWRLDVVLHGRNASLTEVSFLKSFDGAKAAPKDLSHIRLDIFGRGNNAYRWAGEADVFEALEAFLSAELALSRGALLDTARVVLRGFSMGGAGTWHIGLHHPDRWCVVSPGAGFTTTRGYIKDLPRELPAYIESPLHIYDAVDYAENAANVPIVAYSGGDDPQMMAAKLIEDRLKELGIPMQHFVAPGVGHTIPPEYSTKLEAEYAKIAEKGRPGYPAKVRFVTYTLKFDRCDWVQLLGLEQHYKKATVEAESVATGFKLRTENVRSLSLHLPPGATREELVVEIGQQKVPVKPSTIPGSGGELAIYLERQEGRWVSVMPQILALDQLRRTEKVRGLTGPIDDAFTDSFLCVRGTRQPWHGAIQEYADADLKRFTHEWAKYFRGELPIKDDIDVTAEDIASRNLILFGDPGSNSLLAQVVPRLPLKWTEKTLEMGGKTFDSADHLPALIYPSPLVAGRYVVLNSGHTFHEAEFKGTNAQLYPRLGDYAVLKRSATKEAPLTVEVVEAGLFDEFWQLPKR